MFQPSVSISSHSTSYSGGSHAAAERTLFDALSECPGAVWGGIQRRWLRERRRRKVGRAYDMALEIAQLIPRQARVLDAGCGNGFIAHHLSSLLGTDVIGIDLGATTEAAIDYRQFDGKHFPIADGAVNAVLLCYVLHHAQDLNTIMSEMRRVLSNGGLAVIYEDIPEAWWDRFVCWTHNLKWRSRTGPCQFRNEAEWRCRFDTAGFEILSERRLSRWRNLAHPVYRRVYLLKLRMRHKDRDQPKNY